MLAAMLLLFIYLLTQVAFFQSFNCFFFCSPSFWTFFCSRVLIVFIFYMHWPFVLHSKENIIELMHHLNVLSVFVCAMYGEILSRLLTTHLCAALFAFALRSILFKFFFMDFILFV